MTCHHERSEGSALGAVRLCVAAATLFANALHAQATADNRPTIAVLAFSGSSLKNPGDYTALGRGIAELLVSTLAANENVRTVERERLGEVLREQNLAASSDVDPATAVRVGRVLGARHFITGGFLIDTRDRIRIDVRSVNVETSEVEFSENAEGNVADLFALVERIESRASKAIKLERASTPKAALTSGRGNERLALEHFGRAARAMEKADTASAVTAAREALKAFPEFGPAKDLLAALKR